jgi:predicted transcriptional regulator
LQLTALPARLDDRLEEAAAERSAFKSEIVRQAIRYYVRENPHGFAAFTSGSRRNRSGSYDPTGEF